MGGHVIIVGDLRRFARAARGAGGSGGAGVGIVLGGRDRRVQLGHRVGLVKAVLGQILLGGIRLESAAGRQAGESGQRLGQVGIDAPQIWLGQHVGIQRHFCVGGGDLPEREGLLAGRAAQLHIPQHRLAVFVVVVFSGRGHQGGSDIGGGCLGDLVAQTGFHDVYLAAVLDAIIISVLQRCLGADFEGVGGIVMVGHIHRRQRLVKAKIRRIFHRAQLFAGRDGGDRAD